MVSPNHLLSLSPSNNQAGVQSTWEYLDVACVHDSGYQETSDTDRQERRVDKLEMRIGS